MQGGGGGAPNMADMMKNMDPDALAGMAQSTGQPGITPEMAKMAAESMKNMKPEQMQKMMEMSAKMAEAGLKPGGATDPSQMASVMEKVMEDPEMLKASMEMMSNMKDMDPDMLKNMAAQSGMSEEQLKQATEKMA